MKKIKHYNIIEKIASGGMGEVYKAFDTVLEREVAIKVMHRHLLDNEIYAERFMREARIAAKLVHPNVVTIYEVGTAKVGPYIVMELVNGTPLSNLLKSNGAYKPEQAINIATQILSGVQCAYGLKILHRDLKPDNILITAAEQAKILDFGIAKISAKEGLTVAGDLLGTVEYMAPEQLLGEVLDHRCDIYAVGVLFYQMLTNELPFTSESAAAILYKQLNEDALPPSYYNGKIGKCLDDAVLKALSKDREERWNSAQDFSEELQGVLKTEVSAPTAETSFTEGLEEIAEESETEIRTNDPKLNSVFIGRKEELKKLINLFNKSLRGQGQTVIMQGEAGVGKSTLAERLRKYAELNKAWVLYGACLYQEGMDAYMPFIDALRSFFGQESHMLPEQERMELKEIVRKKVPLLLEFTERFTTNFGPKTLPEEGSTESDTANLLDGIYQLIAFISTIRPVVLVIDDLQWADEASLRLFHYISRYVGKNRLYLLGISRTDRYDLMRDGKPAAVVDILSRIRREDACEEIVLNLLTRESCDALIDRALSPSLFTEEFYTQLHSETKGNPLFIGETLKLLCENGGIYFENGNWYNKENDLELAVPNRVEDIFIRRLNGLNDEERELLQVLAIQGHKFDPSLATNLVEIQRIKLLKTLQRIEREIQIITGTEQGYQFEHPMLRDLLYNEVPPALRREYHLMYANEFEKIHGPNYGAFVGDVAQHLRRGGDHTRAIPLLYQAAGRAFALSAYREASLFFEDLLDSLDTSGQKLPETLSDTDLYFKLGICYEESCRWEEATDSYRKLLSLSEKKNELKGQTDALLRMGRIHGKLGDWKSALSNYEQCLKIATEHSMPNVQSRAFNNIGIIYFQKGEFDSAIEYFEKTLEAVDCELGEFDKAHALTNMGILQNIRGEHDAALVNYQKALKIYEKKGNRQQDEGRIYHNLGMTFADRGEWDQAIDAFEHCLKLADEVEDKQLHALTYLNMGKTYIRQNKLGKAKQFTEKALKKFKRMDDTLNMAEGYHIFGLIYGENGNFTASEKFFVASIGINEKMEYQEGLAETYMSYGNLCSSHQNNERAKNCYEKALKAYSNLELTGKVEELSKIIDELSSDSKKEVKIVERVKEKVTHVKNTSTVHHS
ncbi:tetratricopeptide repeat protein [candidate division KSB1 bacterium]|nr:tetratricopeptide repeat protein [candidate division KSB1 bacterium]